MGLVGVIIFSVVAVGLLMTRHHNLWPWTMSGEGAAGEPYGAGSRAPRADNSMPDGYPIKGNADSMLYHRADSRSYGATIAEVWFDTPERAESAGFTLANTHPKD